MKNGMTHYLIPTTHTLNQGIYTWCKWHMPLSSLQGKAINDEQVMDELGRVYLWLGQGLVRRRPHL